MLDNRKHIIVEHTRMERGKKMSIAVHSRVPSVFVTVVKSDAPPKTTVNIVTCNI